MSATMILPTTFLSAGLGHLARIGRAALAALAFALPAWAQAPAITTAPSNATVTAPAAATFTVAATGAPPLAYQWMRDGVAIPGATSASYTTPPTSSLDHGAKFTVTVSNAEGSVTSSSFAGILTVNGPPIVVAQPANQAKAVGATATFQADVRGNGLTMLTGTWKKNGVSVGNGTMTSNADGSKRFTYSKTVALADDGTSYTLTVTTAYGSVTSQAATLSVTTAPSGVTLSVSPSSVYEGQGATFTAASAGSTPITFTLKKSPGGTVVASGTSGSFTLNPVALADGGSYTVTATNAYGSADSPACALTVTPSTPPSFAPGAPADTTVVAETTATFTAVASGAPAPTYQWYRGTSPIGGATGSSCSFTPQLADEGATFYVVATNLKGSATSRVATLHVTPAVVPPSITQQPASQTVEAGQPATFTVAATGSDPMDYQWQRGGVDIPGATSASYTFTATQADNGATFLVKVHNAATTVTSGSATLTVFTNPPQIPAAEPANQTVAAGNRATFTVAATGTAPLAYQWYKGATAISGATSASYTTPVLQLSDNGNTYSVAVTNAAGGANSRQAVLTVTQPALGPMTWKRDIVYLGTKEVAEISSAGVTVTLVDHLGSPRFVVEPTGNVVEQKFLPFGESLLAQADQARVAKGFTNHEQTDPSGLIYMQARFYGPMYHRFLSPDPGQDQHFEFSQKWNIYSYVSNNPVTNIDLDGEQERPVAHNPRALVLSGPDAPQLQLSPRQTKAMSIGAGIGAAGAGFLSLRFLGKELLGPLLGALIRNPERARMMGEEVKAAISSGEAQAATQQAGRWIQTAEQMSERAGAYQSFITGVSSRMSYMVNGVKFDGVTNSGLIDAKGPGYAKFVDKAGNFMSWFKGAQGLVDQATRQIQAAGGQHITWYFAESKAAEATQRLLQSRGIQGIEIVVREMKK